MCIILPTCVYVLYCPHACVYVYCPLCRPTRARTRTRTLTRTRTRTRTLHQKNSLTRVRVCKAACARARCTVPRCAEAESRRGMPPHGAVGIGHMTSFENACIVPARALLVVLGVTLDSAVHRVCLRVENCRTGVPRSAYPYQNLPVQEPAQHLRRAAHVPRTSCA